MLKNEFAVCEVAKYVEEQLINGTGSDLLVCAGSRASMKMSPALFSIWCPDVKPIFLADHSNPPDAVIFPELSAAGLYSLKEYIYTGRTSAVCEEDALIVSGGDYSGHFVDIACKVGQLQDVREGEVQAGNDELEQEVPTVATAGDESSQEVKVLLLKNLFEVEI